MNRSMIALAMFGFITVCAAGCSSATPHDSGDGDASPMLTNRDVMVRFLALVDGKQPEKLREIEAPDVVITNPLGVLDGPAHEQLVTAFAVAFPNLKHTITSCIEEADRIACEGTFTGDQTGPLAMSDGSSLPASNKHVAFGWGSFAKIKDGKLGAMNVYFDVLGFEQQLGVLPKPQAK